MENRYVLRITHSMNLLLRQYTDLTAQLSKLLTIRRIIYLTN